MEPRYLVLAVLLLSYVWRFHDLAPVLSPLRLAALGTVLSWGYLVLTRPHAGFGRMVGHPAMIPLIVGVVWIGITVPSALQPDRAWESWWGVHFKTLTMSLFLLTCLTSIAALKRAMALHIFGAAVLAFFYAKSGFPLWGSPVPMYDVNDLALHLNMTVPFAVYFGVRADRRWIRIACWLLTGAITVSVLMTQSRGAFLTIGIFSVLIILFAKNLRLWVRLVPPVLVACTYTFAPPETKERLSTLFAPQDDYNLHDDEGRIEIWKRGLGYLGDHPITGVGMTNFPVAEATLSARAREGGRARGMVSHNSFLEVAVEGGIPGFALFIAMIGGGLVTLGRMRKRLQRRLGRTAAGEDLVLIAEALMLSLIAYCIGGFFLSMAYVPMLYSVIAITAGFCYWANRALSAAAAAPVPRPAPAVPSAPRVSPPQPEGAVLLLPRRRS